MAARTPSRAAQDRSDNLFWTRDAGSFSLPPTDSASLINFTSRLETWTGDQARNWTIERIIGELIFTVPSATAAGRSYHSFLALGFIGDEAITASAYPEPFDDHKNRNPAWIDGRRVFADHTVPASYPSPGINGLLRLDVRSKRKAKGIEELRMWGHHDNGLGVNPVVYYTYSALWRLR